MASAEAPTSHPCEAGCGRWVVSPYKAHCGERPCIDKLHRSQYTAPQMVDLDTIDKLRDRGAVRIELHPSGALASVEFSNEAAPAAGHQHETSKPAEVTPKRYPTGRIVPRVPIDRP